MAQLGVAGGGAVIGAIAGSFIPGVGTMLGAQIGWAIGGIAGSLLFPEKGPDTHGPRLNDLSVQTSGYGVPIPVVAGTAKLAGNVIWKTAIKETTKRRRQGKGGSTATSTTYSYSLSWAVGLCEWLIPPANAGLLRIWLDNKMVYDATGAYEVTQVPGLTFRFYGGSETQLPDPAIEAAVGASNAPAHRGLCYIVFDDVPLEIFGNRMPNVTVEISGSVTQSFPQVNSVPPAEPLWPSGPSSRTYFQSWACNVAVDYARGRIYEGRSRTSGGDGSANDELIRVYDLITMETLGEYPMGDMVQPFFGFAGGPVAPTTVSVGAGIIHLGADGFLYCTGGSVNRVPLWKIDPDAWRAVGVFGPPEGAGNGFDDNGTRLVSPMQITSVQVPRLNDTPRTLVIVQGAYSSTLTIDADGMGYVWGAGGVAVGPPPVPINLGAAPLTFPVGLAAGRQDLLTGADLWHVRCYNLPWRVEVVRFRYSSGAADLGNGAAMGITRTDWAPVDIAAELDAGVTNAVVQSVWWDASDDTLVITIAAAGNTTDGWAYFTTFKWAQGTGVLWRVVNHAAPSRHDARGRMERVLGGTWGLAGNFVVQPGAGSPLINQAGAEFNNLAWVDEAQAVIGYRTAATGTYEIAKRYLIRGAATALTVGAVVEAICTRSGLDAADVNVAALGDSLRGYTLARPMSARDAITPLAAAFQFDAAEVDDVILFRKRAGSVVASFAFGDLVREDPAGIVIEEQRAQDQELPREVTVRYADIERGWEQGAQSWRRPVAPIRTVGSEQVMAMDLPMPLTAGEAKSIARRMCTATWRERTRLSFPLGPRALRLVPTDPVTIATRDGATIRCRVLSTQLGANWVTRIEAVTEDAAVYGLTAEADSGAAWDEPEMPLPYATRLILPDLALVADGDDLGQQGLREYALACAYDGRRFRGVQIVRSPDMQGWTSIGASTTPAVWGSLTATPGLPRTPWTWDESGSLLIRLTDGEVESATALEVLNGANVAALVSPDATAEIVQFRDAEDLGGGAYRLTGLLRGRRGTEDRIATRGAGDLFVLLDDRLPFAAGITETTAARYHRAVGLFDTVETARPTWTKSARGRAERPYAPCQAAGSRDGSNNLTLTWVRRTRVGGEWLDGTGTVPVSEAAEAYEVDILDGPETVPGSVASSSQWDDADIASMLDNVGATLASYNTAFGFPADLTVEFDEPVTIRSYSLRGVEQLALLASPYDWTLQGYNTTTASWDTIDTVTAATSWTSGEVRHYGVDAPGAYAIYKWSVTSSNGRAAVGCYQFALHLDTGGANIAATTYSRAVKRTITGLSSPTAAYSAAQQTTDFGAVQSLFVFARIHQVSNIVGRGVAAEAAV